MSDIKNLKQLGNKKTKYYNKPNINILETFENQNQERDYLVPFICTEFTSLCPKTGQPDFAKFEIIYIPDVNMVESKSLKLYLFSYRNSGEFHEDVTNRIFNDLWAKLQPKYLRVFGDFAVRGGIAIKPLVERLNLNLITNDGYEEINRLIESYDRIKNQSHEYRI